MKIVRVLGLLVATLPLLILLKVSSFNQVQALAKEDTIKLLNDIDFNNVYSEEEAGNSLLGNTNNVNRAAYSRAKRFISFPVGSSFSTAVCLTTGVIGNPKTEYLSMGLNWGIAYELPNSTWILQHANGFSSKDQEQHVSPQIKRRHRRSLYGKLETLISGFDSTLRKLTYG